jgi:membrane-associated phospholipid phosphatase
MVEHRKSKSFIVKWPRHKIVFLGVFLVAGSILSIFYFDQPLTQWVHESIRGELDSIAKVFTWFGLGDTYFLISASGYLLARLFSQRLTHLSWTSRIAQAKSHFSFMFLSFLVSGLIVLILKGAFGRGRPYQSPDFIPINFRPFTLDWDYQSYPSGHTQVGFTLAAFLSILFPRGTKYFFVFAAIVGFSRVLLEKHYLGDVLAGSYVGILGTYLAWHWRGKKMLFQSPPIK